MMRNKLQLAGLLGMAAMMDGLSMEPIEPRVRRNQIMSVKGGHTSWGHFHDAKVKRGRAKERRAKQARKINWN